MKGGIVGTNNYKKENMKKIFAFLILSVAIVSCYDNYIKDFDRNSIYFPYQIDTRTVVVGEGMKISIGTALGGVRTNEIDRNVTFAVDNTLVTPAVLTAMKVADQYIKDAVSGVASITPLPANYYTLSNSTTMVIKAGQHAGSIVLKPDSTAFLSDPATLMAGYVIALRITSADADTVLLSKNNTAIGLKYENMLYGNYWHGGSALVNRPNKADTTYKYYTTIPQSENSVWTLKTTGPNTLTANGYGNTTVSTKQQMNLAMSGSTITISTLAGSTWPIVAQGTSTYNNAKLLQKRQIFLNYRYVNTTTGYTWTCTDTLSFRNRVRDGINEWQDENPSHYLK